MLSAAALLSLANIHPFFDASFNAGGLIGAVDRARAGRRSEHRRRDNSAGRNCGHRILLATNFSFAFYEKLGQSLQRTIRFPAIDPSAIPRLAHGATREPGTAPPTEAECRGSQTVTTTLSTGPQVVNQRRQASQLDRAPESAEIASALRIVRSRHERQKQWSRRRARRPAPAKRGMFRGKATPAAETAVVAEMLREAAVKRKTEAPASGSLPFESREGQRAKPQSDYQLPAARISQRGADAPRAGRR